jgi:P pilus assembly chaperone PapD
VETVVTWQQASTISAMTTLGVRIEPSVLRVRDADGATAQVVIDNRRGRSRVHVALAGSDPERAMRLTISPPVVDVDPGQVAVASLRVDSWRPAPGTEQIRPFTVTASDNQSEVSGTGSLVQTTSRSAIETLTVRLEPSVLRLGNHRRAQVAAVLDNRGGAQPVRVSLAGDDPENAVRFRIAPAVVDVPPGQQLSVTIALEAPRAPVGQELTRTFTVVASDGRTEIPAQGSLIQSAASRRPLARVLFTLFGGLAIIVGSLSSRSAGQDIDGNDLAPVLTRLAGSLFKNFTGTITFGGFEGLVSADLFMAVLGVVAIFGLTGRTGRLTRLSVALALLLVIGVVITLTIVGRGGLGGGAILVVVGCVAGYIGSKLTRR